MPAIYLFQKRTLLGGDDLQVPALVTILVRIFQWSVLVLPMSIWLFREGYYFTQYYYSATATSASPSPSSHHYYQQQEGHNDGQEQQEQQSSFSTSNYSNMQETQESDGYVFILMLRYLLTDPSVPASGSGSGSDDDDICRHSHFFPLLFSMYLSSTTIFTIVSLVIEKQIWYWTSQDSPTKRQPRTSKIEYLLECKLFVMTIFLLLIVITYFTSIVYTKRYLVCHRDLLETNEHQYYYYFDEQLDDTTINADDTDDGNVAAAANGNSSNNDTNSTNRHHLHVGTHSWWIASSILILSQLAEIFFTCIFWYRLQKAPTGTSSTGISYTASPSGTNAIITTGATASSNVGGGQPTTMTTTTTMTTQSSLAATAAAGGRTQHELTEELWADRCNWLCQCLSISTCCLFGGQDLINRSNNNQPTSMTRGYYDHVARALADFVETRGTLDVVPTDIVAGLLVLQRIQRQRVLRARLYVKRSSRRSLMFQQSQGKNYNNSINNTGNDRLVMMATQNSILQMPDHLMSLDHRDNGISGSSSSGGGGVGGSLDGLKRRATTTMATNNNIESAPNSGGGGPLSTTSQEITVRTRSGDISTLRSRGTNYTANNNNNDFTLQKSATFPSGGGGGSIGIGTNASGIGGSGSASSYSSPKRKAKNEKKDQQRLQAKGITSGGVGGGGGGKTRIISTSSSSSSSTSISSSPKTAPASLNMTKNSSASSLDMYHAETTRLVPSSLEENQEVPSPQIKRIYRRCDPNYRNKKDETETMKYHPTFANSNNNNNSINNNHAYFNAASNTQQQQQQQQQGQYYQAQSRQVLDPNNPIDCQRIEEGARMGRFALSIYTWMLYLYVHPVKGMMNLLFRTSTSNQSCFFSTSSTSPSSDDHCSCCCCMHGHWRRERQRGRWQGSLLEANSPSTPVTVGDNICQWHKHALLLVAGLENDESDLIYAEFRNGFSQVPYCILLDHKSQSVIVSIRGSLSLDDLVTDVNVDPVCVDDLGQEFGFDSTNQYCHAGVVACVRNVYRDLQRHGILEQLLSPSSSSSTTTSTAGLHTTTTTSAAGGSARRSYPHYQLRLVGHSLGAAVCTLLGYMLRPRYPNLHVYNYSPPGCSMTWDLATRCIPWATTFVLDSDIVPRLSVLALEELRDEILTLVGRLKVPKYQVVQTFLKRRKQCCGLNLRSFVNGSNDGRRRRTTNNNNNNGGDIHDDIQGGVGVGRRDNGRPNGVDEYDTLDEYYRQDLEELNQAIDELLESDDATTTTSSDDDPAPSLYQRQLQEFLQVQEERKQHRFGNQQQYRLRLYPPGNMIHLVKTGEEEKIQHALRKCITCCMTNAGFSYTPVYIANDDLNEIVVSPTMGTDHFIDRMFDELTTLANDTFISYTQVQAGVGVAGVGTTREMSTNNDEHDNDGMGVIV